MLGAAGSRAYEGKSSARRQAACRVLGFNVLDLTGLNGQQGKKWRDSRGCVQHRNLRMMVAGWRVGYTAYTKAKPSLDSVMELMPIPHQRQKTSIGGRREAAN